MQNRSGYFITNLSGEAEYNSFRPAPLPPIPHVTLDGEMSELLIKANRKVALLDGLSSRMPNIDLFVAMCIRKEALVSSQIEGTQEMGILSHTAKAGKAKIYSYIDYLDILRKDT